MKTLKEYIHDAGSKGVAIGHFNISNLEAFHAITDTAKKLNVPVIIGVSEGERDFVGIREAYALVKSKQEEGQPVFLNADHTYSFERVKAVVDLGYDAVIIDGAKLSFDENVALTKKCVEYARSVNPEMLIEGELGYIGTSSKVFDKIPEGAATVESQMTTPEEALKFVQMTGIDMLAPAVGNIHGLSSTGVNPHLFTNRIKEIHDAINIPMVLHGGSGIPDEDFVAAAGLGMSIIHINTEIRVAFAKELRAYLVANPDETAPYKIMQSPRDAIARVVENRLKVFNKLT